MAVARYWRLRAVSPHGAAALDISELQLWGESARLDTGVTITSALPPATGSLASLSDGVTDTSVSWARAQWSSAAFALVWDLVTPGDARGVVIGTGSSLATSLGQFTLEHSADAETWVPLATDVGWVEFPGPNQPVSVLRGAAPAFRYWRLFVTQWREATFSPSAPDNIGLVRIAEFELYEDTVKHPLALMTGPNTPSPYVATAHSQYSSEVPPWHAFNGLINDTHAARWFSDESRGNKWLMIDLGAPVPVTHVAVAPDGSVYAGSGYWLVSFSVQGSNTGAFTGEEYTLLSRAGLAQSVWVPSERTMFYPDEPNGVFSNVHPARRVSGFTIDTFASASNSAPMTIFSLPRMLSLGDLEMGGQGRILGTVKIDGDPTDTPVKRKVRLYRDIDGKLVRETWSNETTGAYAFEGISLDYRYTVLSLDHTHFYRAVLADNITPEVMS